MTRLDPTSAMLSAMRPPEKLTIWEWAEKHIFLSPRQATGFPGYYRSGLTPYVKGIFEALQDNSIRKVTVEKGAQTGLTLCGYIWLCYTIAEDSGSILLVYPSESLARSASETRFMPLIEDSPILKEQMPEDRDEWTKLQQRMKRATINWVGSNSPANLASRPIRYLFLDEVDKYPVNNQTEANPIALAEQRTKTFWNRKIFKISTPTTEEGAIHSDYLSGDQRRFFVPCPYCKTMQFLIWPNVKWPDKEPEKAQYECPHCKEKWTDIQKNAAVSRGEWRATTKAKNDDEVSFHLSSLYSGWTKFGALASKFLQSKSNANVLQDFINSELGEPFVHYDMSIKDEAFAIHEGAYVECQTKWHLEEPYKTRFLGIDLTKCAVFGGVDVQKGYLVAAFRLYMPTGDSGLIWAGTLPNWEQLEKQAQEFAAQYVFVDSRYRTAEVNAWCAENIGYLPCQGVMRKSKILFSRQTVNIDEGTRNQGQGRLIELIAHDPDQLKNILAGLIQQKEDEQERLWLIPQGYSLRKDYCSQMSAERCIAGKWQAVPAGKPNHFWDAEILTLLAACVTNTYPLLMIEPDNSEDGKKNDEEASGG